MFKDDFYPIHQNSRGKNETPIATAVNPFARSMPVNKILKQGGFSLRKFEDEDQEAEGGAVKEISRFKAPATRWLDYFKTFSMALAMACKSPVSKSSSAASGLTTAL